jgi:hypothetical protein
LIILKGNFGASRASTELNFDEFKFGRLHEKLAVATSNFRDNLLEGRGIPGTPVWTFRVAYRIPASNWATKQ